LVITGKNSIINPEERRVYLANGIAVAMGDSNYLGYLAIKVKNLYKDQRFVFGKNDNNNVKSEALIATALSGEIEDRLEECSNKDNSCSPAVTTNSCREKCNGMTCEYIPLDSEEECLIWFRLLDDNDDNKVGLTAVTGKLTVEVSGQTCDEVECKGISSFEGSSTFSVAYEKALFVGGVFSSVVR
jgi:hypothetical protein